MEKVLTQKFCVWETELNLIKNEQLITISLIILWRLDIQPLLKQKKEAGDKWSSKGPFQEPFKSINDKYNELDVKWSKALGAERVAAIPILKLLGYENPSKYLYYLYAGYRVLSEEYGVKDLRDIEGWNTAQELFGHKGIGMAARDDFCKLYGVEFDYKYNEINY